jgi:CHAT domain-containing protein/Tfp pilus assembly protein PilF
MSTPSSPRRLSLIAPIVLLAAAAAVAQGPPALAPGVVVEALPADAAAARAGLAVGDRLVGADGRQLPSPAALQAIEENTFGKDSIVLSVERRADTLMLVVPAGKLGIEVRPVLPAAALELYVQGQAAQQARKGDEVITAWVAAARSAQAEGHPSAAAWLYERVGRIHEGQRRWKEAGAAHVDALQVLKQHGDPAARSRTLSALGRCSFNQNDFPAAHRWYAQAEQVDSAAGYETWASNDLVNLGAVAYGRGDLTAAEGHYRRALGMFERLTPDSLDVADVVLRLGNVAYGRGDLSAAEEHYRRALGLRERLAPESLSVAATLNNLGNVLGDRGNLAAAEDHYRRALVIRERLAPDSLPVANHLDNLGGVLRARGNLAAAEDYHRRALAIRERLAPDSLALAQSFSNLGIVARLSGDLAAAQDYHRRALGIREKLSPGSLIVAASFTDLGVDAEELGDLSAAHDYLTRALAIEERQAPGSLAMAGTLNTLGNVAWRRGDLASAQDYHGRALSIRERLAPDSLSLAVSLNNLGLTAGSRGDLAAARDHHLRALAIKERLAPDSLTLASSLNNLGEVLLSLGDLDAARDHHSRALAIKARDAPDSMTVADSLDSLGKLASARRDPAMARDYHSRALAIRDRLAPESLAVAESLHHLGAGALKERRLTDALASFTRAVAIIEGQRGQIRSADTRAFLVAQYSGPYGGLLRTYLELGDLPSAFATAERARARSLLDILTEAAAGIRQGVDADLLERERLLQRQLNATAARQTQVPGAQPTSDRAAAVRKELDTLLTRYKEVQAEIRATSPRYAALTQPLPLDLAAVQQQVLDPGTLLLEYWLGDEASWVFVVTRESIRGFDLPPRAAIEQAARRMYELLTARQSVRRETLRQRRARIARADTEYTAAAEALSRMVLAPVAGELAGKRLVIVADGALQYVPFAALPLDDEPLMIRHEVVSLPSASVMAVLRRELGARPPAEQVVAVVADPVFDARDPRVQRTARGGADTRAPVLPADLREAARSAGLMDDRGALARLPFTRDEAAAIAALAPEDRRTTALDFSASRSRITRPELGRYRIVHIATHGLVNTEHPELSGIVLSLVDERGQAQDGFLRLHDVYNLNWTADLVVLSACQTALGKEIRGEGLVGLTRGFMYGGARRVLASLWNVNDGATAQFMRHFYQAHLGQGLSPPAALRVAQVEMWKRPQWRSPYYWAAFVLQGEWRTAQ